MTYSLLFCVLLGFIANNSPTDADGFDEALYRSYLHWPRLHFSGLFQADTPTINNRVSNYDISTFDEMSASMNGTGGWNADGTGAFFFSKALVTRVCFPDGRCCTEKALDPVIGSYLQDSGRGSFPKMAVLDPGDILTSTVFGLRLEIGNFLAGDVHPCTKTYFWDKEHGKMNDVLYSAGATFHCFVKNITWLGGARSSKFLRQLHGAVDSSGTGRLSLRFHLDQYQKCPFSDNFNWGRVVGAIGVSGAKAPLSTVCGRELEPKEKDEAQIANFVLDREKRRVHVDFGNSLPTTLNGSFSLTSVGPLAVGFSRDPFPRRLSCSNNFHWLGVLHYRRRNWYQDTAGIQTFPESSAMTNEDFGKLERTPLVVAKVEGEWPNVKCIDIFLEEAADGILVRPHGEWIYRRDAEEPFTFDLFATKFGKPLPQAPVFVRLEDETLKHPPLTIPSEPSITDHDGIASFTIQTADPKNPRKVIDGQMYRILFRHGSQAFQGTFAIYVLIWDKYQMDSEPNWVDHVYPIFKQYANLYPAMTKNFINLGNFDDVVRARKIIKMGMTLPFEHPNYMPITRDLSKAKREMILRWLSQPEPLHGAQRKIFQEKPHNYTGEPEQSVLESLSHTANCQRNPVMSLKHSREFCPVEDELSCEPRSLTTHSLAAENLSFNKRTLAENRWYKNAIPTNHFQGNRRIPSGQLSGHKTGTVLPFAGRSKENQNSGLMQLRRDLQTALELEHATIPPYLTALYSIKDGYNSKARHLIKTIVVQEMLHMSLVANLINAVGGKPSLTHPDFVPHYPSPLPSNIHKGLIVPLQNLSRDLIKDVFMEIEEPGLTVKVLEDRRYIQKQREEYWQSRRVELNEDRARNTGQYTQNLGNYENDAVVDNLEDSREGQEQKTEEIQPKERKINDTEGFECLSQDDSDASSNRIFKSHKDTIGTFYQHIINTLGQLTKCGRDNSIFTGHPSHQLTPEVWYSRAGLGHGNLIQVTDYSSAIRAITEIIEQGEGSSPCTPIATDVDIHDLSHYFSFYSIYKGRMVRTQTWNGTELPPEIPDEVKRWYQVCGSIYTFDGDKIDLEPAGIWPIASSPQITDFTPWSISYLQALAFNRSYKKLLGTLERAYNGRPEGITDAMGVMFSLGLNAKRLVRMPLKFGDDPHIGPNAAPIYRPISF